MTDANLTLILKGVKDLRLEDHPVPEPGPGEVRISIRSVGICGSDVRYWQTGGIGDYAVKAPMVMGHEPSGVVTKLGEGVTGLAVGDRVAVEPNKPCSRCELCRTGNYHLCVNLAYLATPPTHGCLARFYCHPADFVHKLPDNVSFDEGAMVQPISLGFHACERGGITVGNYVLVCGAGPLGMSVVLAAKARGATKICVTDVNQERLDYIRKIGADVTVNVGSEPPREQANKIVAALGRQPDVTVECSGYATSTGIYATKPTGTLVQAGFGGSTVEVPLVIATLKELDIRGSCRFVNDYPRVIEAMAAGQVNARQLVTHRFSLEKAMDAYDAALRGEGVKIIIDCTRTGQ